MRTPTPSNSPVRYTPPGTPNRQTFSDSLMEENIEMAEAMITKWDPKASDYNKVNSLLFTDSRYEAKQFLICIKNLQLAMHYFVNHQHSSSDKLVRAQGFMQIAMKRLQKEFYDILSINKQYLDHESVSNHFSQPSTPRSSSVSSDNDSSDDDQFTFSTEASLPEEIGSSLAMADLKAIADCMISSGYGKECVNIYKLVRKSTVDEALYRLGMDWAILSAQGVQKMDWEVLEGKIKIWLRAVKVSVKSIFYGERILCDHVFSSSLPVQQACFQAVTRDGALALLGFPGNVAKTKKLSPEKMFRILDMYKVVSNLLPEIEFIFSFDSMVDVRSKAIKSLDSLGEAACFMLTAFETAIENDASKMAVPGGGIHPLTRYVMNYLTFLSDYSHKLGDIVAEWSPPKTGLAHLSELPEDAISTSALTTRLAWLILLLLCKLDRKAKLYKEVALSYLFMANNLHYVLVKVRNSNLKYLLGDIWVLDHDVKEKDFIGNYEKMAWTRVMNMLPIDSTVGVAPGQAKETFRRFNLAFEESYQKQKTWVVSDPKMRGEIKERLARNIGRGYTTLYKRYGAELRREAFRESIVRFTPEDLENYLADLFHESVGSGSVSSMGSSYSGHSDEGRVRR